MRQSIQFVLALASVGAALFPSAAQLPPAVTGTVVRVAHVDTRWRSPIVGTLVSASADSILVRRWGAHGGDALTALRRADVQLLETRRLAGTRAGRGAALGALAGMAVGGAAGGLIASGQARRCSQCDRDMTGLKTAAGVVEGALGGALAGLVVGSLLGERVPRYRWVQSALP